MQEQPNKYNKKRCFVYYKAWNILFNGTTSLSLYPEGRGRTSVGVLQSDWVQMWSFGPQ